MTDPRPGDGNAYRLKVWWATEGKSRWASSPSPWRTLRAMLLEKGVPNRQVNGLTTNIMKMAGVTWSGHGEDREYHGLRGRLTKLKPEHKAALRKVATGGKR